MKKKLFIQDNIGFIELLDVFGNDLTVVNAARVSHHKESHFEEVHDNTGNSHDNTGNIIGKLSDRDVQLIKFLAQHKHITPFFHPIIRFRIKMPIFVAREWYRHTVGFARNEMSRRYVTDEPEFFVPGELRKRDKNIKQGSSSEIVPNNQAHVQDMKQYCTQALAYYNQLLEHGVCPEQARMILPQSMYTEFIETASLSGYARLVKLRIDPTAQREIQSYAHFVSTFLKEKFPVSWDALMQY